MATILELEARIEITGVNPYVQVTADQVRRIKSNWRKPLPVLVQINGDRSKSWSTNMIPTGTGDFYLYLHGAMRNASGTAVGDIVKISLQFDEQYRNGPQHAVPAWFQKALDEHAMAQLRWNELSPSRQKEILRYFANLRSDEAKKRNLTRVIGALQDEQSHFMGRNWKNGK